MSTLDLATPAQAQPRGRSLDIAAFVAGALAAALGIAIGELIGGLIAGAPSLVIAIGDLVIELQPPGAKDLFVTLFGEADKLVLNLMIVGAAILIAGGLVSLGALLFEPLSEAFRDRLEGTEHRPEIPVIPAALGTRAGAIGAAVLARDLLS